MDSTPPELLFELSNSANSRKREGKFLWIVICFCWQLENIFKNTWNSQIKTLNTRIVKFKNFQSQVLI